jgi:hypothetical protein
MAKKSGGRRSDLPSALRKKFDELAVKIRGPIVATAVWNRHFTDAERQTLGGDAYQAWKHHGGIAAMWSAVRGVSINRAIIEIAYEADWLDTPTRTSLLKALNEDDPQAIAPRWLKATGELWFGDAVIRWIRRPQQAKNIVRILDSFELDGWPPRIDDPITGGGDSSARRRAIESLNKGLKAIRFSCAGDGEAFCWEEIPAPTRKKRVAKNKPRKRG